MSFHDISLKLSGETVRWVTAPPFELEERRRMSKGDPNNSSALNMSVHSGTHVQRREAVGRIAQIMENCGLKTSLSSLGVAADGLDTLVEHTRWDRVSALPTPLGHDDLRRVLQDLM